MAGDDENKNDNNNVEGVAMPKSLPPFWTSSPEAWFIQVESQFELFRVTRDKSKYAHVISALPQDTIIKVLDVIQKPPQENLYVNLKAKLIERFSDSEEKRISQLLFHTEIGDRKPSDFFRHLTQLAGTSTEISENFIKNIWSQRLPNIVAVAIIPFTDKPIDDLLSFADKIWEASQNQISAFSGPTPPPPPPSDPKIELLERQMSQQLSMISELKTIVSEMSHKSRKNYGNKWRNGNNNNYRNQDRSRSRSRSNNFHKFCFFHHKYGSLARRCVPPCQFVSSNSDSNQGDSKK